MNLKDKLTELAKRLEQFGHDIDSEEQTKNSLVLPFIEALGYNIHEPTDVKAEVTCDVGIKRGEKVDYCIYVKGRPSILVECKSLGYDLSLVDGQLLRYFHCSEAKFSILTDGREYRFYTDLDNPNKMDQEPFLSLDLNELREEVVKEVSKFAKAEFDVYSLHRNARDMRYRQKLKERLASELNEPSSEFVRLIAKPLYPEVFTQRVESHFAPLLKQALKSYINDLLSSQLEKCSATQIVTTNKERTDDLVKNQIVQEQVGQAYSKKTPSKGLSVTFPDGEVIQYSRGIETFIAALRKIGFSVAHDVGIIHAGYNLVDKQKRPVTDGDTAWQHAVEDGWYVYANISNKVKAQDLREISRVKGLGLIVEV